uniref:Uncharacterized protein n=1 Tax=Chlamydomonas leiostraca TaxID=1034604 RepID=A0A7S0RPJ7_9CHLO
MHTTHLHCHSYSRHPNVCNRARSSHALCSPSGRLGQRQRAIAQHDEYGPSTSSASSSSTSAGTGAAKHEPCMASRRGVAAATAAAMLSAIPAGPAQALKTVTLKDGSSVEVYEHGMSLSIVGLRGSVPAQWILDYKSALGRYAGFALGQRPHLNDIYKELAKPGDRNSAGAADVATLGDAWLGPAIKEGLLQPIPKARTQRWWRGMSPRWQALVTRDAQGNPSPDGEVYGAPYRWGCTVVAYRRDRLESRGGRQISDWSDLLQPKLEGRVAMTDSSREFMGIALKTLGFGFNATARQLAAGGVGVQELAGALRALRKQVKLFSARDHVRALSAGDVWAVVGWSQELTLVGERSNAMEVIVPRSGTSLFADLWAVPAHAHGGHLQRGPSPLLPSWLEFGLAPARVASLPGLKTGASPILLPDAPLTTPTGRATAAPSMQPGVLNHDGGYMPADPACLRASEFLLPLDADTVALYREALELSSQPAAAAAAAAQPAAAK